ncbi:MAG: hypothetical protein WC309_04045 [Candidatus Paceibacterota bacterium]
MEARSGTDYDVKQSKYNATVIEAVISQGEREINTKLGQTFTGTIPDGIKAIAIELAYRRMYNMMVWDGNMDRENPKKEMMPLWDEDLLSMLSSYRAKNITPIKLHRLYNVVGYQ